VAANGWYKGMPQIAFVAAQGLPDGLCPAYRGIWKRPGGTERDFFRNTMIRFRRAAGVLLRAVLVVALACFCAHTAEAKTKSKKKTSSSSRKSVKKHVSLNEVFLKPADYPAEISGRIALYNNEVTEINALRKKDPSMAKARGEVLKIRKESFDQYAAFMASTQGREADKIRKTVAANGWYKGMPQIAFVAAQGLPDDLTSQDANRLTLIYKSGCYHFDRGRLRSFDAPR